MIYYINVSYNISVGEYSQTYSWKSIDWASSNCLIVIPVIAENCAKVANDIDHEEDRALLRAHGEIGATGIAFDWMSLGSFYKEVVYLGWATKILVCRVCGKGKHQKDN
jgi:hypothetical protein